MVRFAIALAACSLLCSTQARAWALVCSAPIPATMVDKVDSATAYPGMTFRFKITVTARVDGVLLPDGTIGYGVVREVSAASNRARNGTLVLEMRNLYSGNQTIPVTADPRETSLWAPAATVEEAAEGYLPIPGIVRTAVDEVRNGRNVTIGPGFDFHILSLPDPRNGGPCHKVGE
jgi:hypothetical protein